MKKNILLLYKKRGQTPLEAIEEFKNAHVEYKTTKLGYAGRLDPLAEGLLLVLIGDENKKKSVHEALDKTYEFSVLFGAKTDTYDLMGLAQKNFYHGWTENDGYVLKKYLKKLLTTTEQSYPPFSSRTVNGVPLYKLARENRLTGIKIPSHRIKIKSIKLLGTSHIESQKLLSEIATLLGNVRGNFRQKEILIRWEEILHQKMVFTVKHFEITASSGTYVRGIADEMGKNLNKEALALSIKRTRIGDYTLEDVEDFNKKPA